MTRRNSVMSARPSARNLRPTPTSGRISPSDRRVDVRRRELIQLAENPGELAAGARRMPATAPRRAPSGRESSRGGLLGTRVQREPRAVRAGHGHRDVARNLRQPLESADDRADAGRNPAAVLAERRAETRRELDRPRVAADLRALSSTSTRCCRRFASVVAATRPFGPAPITMASYFTRRRISSAASRPPRP